MAIDLAFAAELKTRQGVGQRRFHYPVNLKGVQVVLPISDPGRPKFGVRIACHPREKTQG
jgi:hypothetical protein